MPINVPSRSPILEFFITLIPIMLFYCIGCVPEYACEQAHMHSPHMSQAHTYEIDYVVTMFTPSFVPPLGRAAQLRLQ